MVRIIKSFAFTQQKRLYQLIDVFWIVQNFKKIFERFMSLFVTLHQKMRPLIFMLHGVDSDTQPFVFLAIGFVLYLLWWFLCQHDWPELHLQQRSDLEIYVFMSHFEVDNDDGFVVDDVEKQWELTPNGGLSETRKSWLLCEIFYMFLGLQI